MSDLILERDFKAPVSRLFEMITLPENMVRWWGHGDMTITGGAFDFSRPGPWHSIMTGADGRDHKVSGEVTEVDPPHEVRFTWGWHDAEDNRGAESQVSIRIIDLGDRQARLVLRHVGLADAEVRQGHNRGWSAFLQKFAAGVAEAAP